MLSLEEGNRLVKLAREVINSYFSGKEIDIKDYGEKRGLFVTLHRYPFHELRGCIGFPEPIMDLNYALVEAARAAAFSDPRFMPVSNEEMNDLIIEVSVLTKPKLIKDIKEINIGKDGLIVECGGRKGLLLPVVAVEHKWTVKEFLENTCLKAGLSENCWKEKDCKIYTFQSQVFSEVKPNGEIVDREF
jgi:uncharacterized protein (TIGR00296 family)